MSSESYLARRAIYQSRHPDAPADSNAESLSESCAVVDDAAEAGEEKQSPESSRVKDDKADPDDGIATS
jgi:hypothetical protein